MNNYPCLSKLLSLLLAKKDLKLVPESKWLKKYDYVTLERQAEFIVYNGMENQFIDEVEDLEGYVASYYGVLMLDLFLDSVNYAYYKHYGEKC